MFGRRGVEVFIVYLVYVEVQSELSLTKWAATQENLSSVVCK